MLCFDLDVLLAHWLVVFVYLLLVDSFGFFVIWDTRFASFFGWLGCLCCVYVVCVHIVVWVLADVLMIVGYFCFVVWGLNWFRFVYDCLYLLLLFWCFDFVWLVGWDLRGLYFGCVCCSHMLECCLCACCVCFFCLVCCVFYVWLVGRSLLELLCLGYA